MSEGYAPPWGPGHGLPPAPYSRRVNEALDALRDVFLDFSSRGARVSVVVSTGFGHVEGYVGAVGADYVRLDEVGDDWTIYVALPHVVTAKEVG